LGEPRPEARRANPEILASVSEPQKVRLAGCHRAPPRSWTLLIALAGFHRRLLAAAGGQIGGQLLTDRPVARPGIFPESGQTPREIGDRVVIGREPRRQLVPFER